MAWDALSQNQRNGNRADVSKSHGKNVYQHSTPSLFPFTSYGWPGTGSERSATSCCWAREQHPHPQYFLSAWKNWCVGTRTGFPTSAHTLSVLRRMWSHHPDKHPSKASTEIFFWVEEQIKAGRIFSIFLSRLYFSVLNHQYLWEKGCLIRSVTQQYLSFKFLL